jgi:branched-chain amino acid transport system permease protein
MLLQQIVSGLINGSIYSLLGVGVVMIFKATNTVNFAQGEFFMLGGYVSFFFYMFLGSDYVVAFVLAALALAALGLIVERIVFRPLIKAPHISTIVAAIGLSFILKGSVRLLVGPEELPFRPAMRNKPVNFYGLIITPQQELVILFTFLFVITLVCFFKYTKLGKSMRAVCSNKNAASLMGISVEKVFSITWGLSASLGGAAGVLLAPVILVYPDMGMVIMRAFAAAAIGGFSSLGGSIIGGFIVGILENLAGGYISTSFTEIVAFWIIIAVLIVKPTGLFGQRLVKKV